VSKLICPVCGRETIKLYGGMCKDCYLKEHRLLDEAPVIRVSICKYCGSLEFNGKWYFQSKDVPQVLIRLISGFFKRKRRKLRILELKIDNLSSKEIRYYIKVIGSLHEDLEDIVEEHYFSIPVKSKVCPSCRKIAGKVVKAILQIRAGSRGLSAVEKKMILRFIGGEIDKMRRRNRDAVILDIVEKKHYIDLMFTSHNVARSIAQKLQKTFHAKISESVKIIGVNKRGKPITKLTILALLPTLKEGSILILNNRPYYIKEVRRDGFLALNLDTYNTSLIRGRVASKGNMVNESELIPALVVSVTPPYVQVMRYDDYKVIEVRLSRIPLWIREKSHVRLFQFNDKYFIVPEST